MKLQLWFVLALSLSIFGCGDAGPTLVPVHGRLTLDGAPLAGKTIRFFPDKTTPGQGSGGSSDQDGNYTVLAVRPGATRDMPGTPAGTYRVIVTEPMFPNDFPVQNSSDSNPTPAIGLPDEKKQETQKQRIPQVYTSRETTPLTITVPETGGEINLELKSPGDQ